MVEWSFDLRGCNVYFVQVWVWVIWSVKHCGWCGEVCGCVGVEKEVGGFEGQRM